MKELQVLKGRIMNVDQNLNASKNIWMGTRSSNTYNIRQPVHTARSIIEKSRIKTLNQNPILGISPKKVDSKIEKEEGTINPTLAKPVIANPLTMKVIHEVVAKYDYTVVDPYNPKREKKSLVDFKTKRKLIMPKGPAQRVGDDFYKQAVQKVRMYVYSKGGQYIARKREYAPKILIDNGPKIEV